MTSTSDYRGLGLKSLAPESWGRRLARARAAAGYNLRDVEKILSDYLSRATLNRLESLEVEPTNRRDRRRAFLVVVLYGWDPADFGLSPCDRPPAIDLKALARLRLRGTGWLRGIATCIARAA